MDIRRIARQVLCAAALAAAATAATAVDWGMSDGTLEALSHDATQSLLIREVLRDASAGGRRVARPASTSRATVAATGAGAGLAQRVAPGADAARRAEIERSFAQLLRGYRQIEQRFGIPPGDVGGAVAAFVAGGLMAYRNEDFPDAAFGPLVEQMRGVVATQPDFARAGAGERRAMYEQLAILGMSMAGAQIALKRQPDARVEAGMRSTAKAQLEGLLGVDPQRLQITGQGLVVR